MKIKCESKRTASLSCFLALVLMLSICLCGVAGAESDGTARQNVLIIHSYEENYKWTSDINKGIMDSLRLDSLSVFTDCLDSKRIKGDGYYGEFMAFQRSKYEGISFDLIICSDNEALDYMLSYGSLLFGETPVVFCAVNDYDKSLIEGRSNYTGILENIDYRGTLDSIRKMQPDLRTIYVLSTDSALSRMERQAVEALVPEQVGVDIVFENNLEEGRLKDLKSRSYYDTAVLMLADPVVKNGIPVTLDSVEKETIEGVNLPVYVTYDFAMGNGYIGGNLVSGYKQGSSAGAIAEKILAGTAVSDIPVTEESPNVYTYDYTALKKFGILKANLPEASVILNKPFSFLETYRTEALAVLAVFSLLALLIVLLIINIRKRKQSEKRFQFALEGTNDAVWELDIPGNRFIASGKWKEITGYDSDIKVNLSEYLENVHPDDRRTVFRTYSELKDRKDSFTAEFRLKVATGEYKWIQVRGKVLTYKDRSVRAYGYIGDISSQKKYEEEIRHLAYYDKLTGLMNRASIMKMLDEKLIDMKARHEKGAVYFVDLDDFKKVNDTMGHDCGDILLAAAASRLRSCSGKNSYVGRLSGDEFLVIKYDTKDMREITDLAYALTQVFLKSFTIVDKQVFVTASVGVTLYPEDGTDSASLLKNADTAMYRAKESGKNKFKFYNVSMNKDIMRKTVIEKELREAIRNDELKVFYQPYFSFKTGEIAGMEALLRWNSPKLGYVPPYEFIAIAEEAGLMVELGSWVIDTVCRQNMAWRAKGLGDIFTSVNISVMQINETGFLETVKGILVETELPTEALGIEINESVLMGGMRYNDKSLEALASEGVRIFLDDFGTGYSSLTYLARVPLSAIKIDKSFVELATESSKTVSIIHGIVELAHKMNLKVIAEGVSTQAQYDILKGIGCDEVQGYLTGRPMPAEEADKLF
ncbi:MAG: diguanylate cyclase/phosphodiesterase with sensor(s) [Firmicutes bacterium]|nr:diguanylate cyclase/phosphodiesterase with sensor(s) [Bacillota bacterium]